MASNPQMRDRETRGVVVSDIRLILHELQILALRNRELGEFASGKPDCLYTAIDPSGGGGGSEYSIATLAMHGNKIMVSDANDSHNARVGVR